MRLFLRKYWPVLLACLVVCLPALATLPKASWATGEILRSADLTADMAHLEAGLRGGTHTLIVNADVSAAAAIQNTKLKAPTPKGMVYASATCNVNGACALAYQQPTGFFTSVVRTAQGFYTITLAVPRPNSVWHATAGPNSSGNCIVEAPLSTTQAAMDCVDFAGAAKDQGFTIVVWDNDANSGE